jgi:hypothetical protein
MLRNFSRSIVAGSRVVKGETVAVRACVVYYQPTQIRNFHKSVRAENELIIGGLAVGAAAITLQYALKGYAAFAQKRAETGSPDASTNAAPEGTENSTQEESATVNSSGAAAEENKAEEVSAEAAEAAEKQRKEAAQRRAKATAQNVDSWFGNWNSWFAKNFYDGGFEEKMTKREAALILGVRESATPERVKEAHRRIMQINHPDKGGSAYLTAKVNEAKDLLLKGK